MNIQERKKILKKFLNSSTNRFFSGITEAHKEQILEALGGEKMVKKKSKINRNSRKSIDTLCKVILDNLSNEYVTGNLKHLYRKRKETWKKHREKGLKNGDIVENKEMFEHTKTQAFNRNTKNFLKKLKFSSDINPDYNIGNKEKAKRLQKEYYHPDLSKIPMGIVYLTKDGQVNKSPSQKDKVKAQTRLLKNENTFKDMVFDYKALPLDQTEENKTTDRIIKIKLGNGNSGYIVSEHTPRPYTENHLRNKYQKNKIRFHVFDNKQNLLKYLEDEIPNMHAQKDRFKKIKDYFQSNFKSDPGKHETLLLLQKTLKHHMSYTDHLIANKIEQLLHKNKRGKDAIVKSIIYQLNNGVRANEKKTEIMKEHIQALKKNPKS